MAFHSKRSPRESSESLKQCFPTSFTKMYTLSKLFAMMALSSCFCGRSPSVLRNNYLRCMQFSAFALIHMNYETEINLDNICKIFIEKYPRKMEKASLLF